MLLAPSRHSFIALAALAVVGASAECLPSDHYIAADPAAGLVEQCCPQFAQQASHIPCDTHIVDGFHSITCSFVPQGNDPYIYIVPQSESKTQDLYVELRGAAGESTRLHRGGKGASIEGTMKAKPGLLYVYVGAGGGGSEDRITQSGRGVFWGAGGGYSSIGSGLPNGQDVAGGRCFRHAQSAKHGDCRILVAAGGGGAGPKSDGQPAGVSKLGMRHNMAGQGTTHGDTGGSGGGFLGGKIWTGHGGGGGAMRVGAGSFKTLYRNASPSTEAFASIRASCYAPITPSDEAEPSSLLTPSKPILNQADGRQAPYHEEYVGRAAGLRKGPHYNRRS